MFNIIYVYEFYDRPVLFLHKGTCDYYLVTLDEDDMPHEYWKAVRVDENFPRRKLTVAEVEDAFLAQDYIQHITW